MQAFHCIYRGFRTHPPAPPARIFSLSTLTRGFGLTADVADVADDRRVDCLYATQLALQVRPTVPLIFQEPIFHPGFKNIRCLIRSHPWLKKPVQSSSREQGINHG